MANVLVNEQYLKDIADAVRNKLGTTEKMLPSSMARHIDLISSGSSDSEETLMFFLTRSEQMGYDDEDNEIIVNEDKIEKITNFNWPKDLPMIGSHAFYNSIGMAVTSLPETVTYIGEYAFCNCKNLALTSLPENIIEIGRNAFEGCKNLALTSLPARLMKIERNAFAECENLALTSLPDSITEIGYSAFRNCKNLALTSLPENIIFGRYAFEKCENLALTSLPDSMTEIPSGVFRDCTNLALTSLPAGLTKISYSAFAECENLALTSLPDSIIEIGSGAFRNCTNLALTSLPAGLTEIEDSVFENCTNLSLTSFPENLTRIRFHAFAGCTGITDIVISPEGPEIERDAFRNCNFETVTFNGSGDYQYEITNAILDCSIDTLILNENVIYSYNNYHLVWWWLQEVPIREVVVNFDFDTTLEGETSFRTCPSEILTFNKYYSPRWNNICECVNLTTINFKNGVKTSDMCIYDCGNLSTISICLSEQGVTELNYGAIGSCPSLSTINIIGPSDAVEKGMITIDEYAFVEIYNPITINVSWSEGEVANAPWGANNATINYNYTSE